MATFELNLVSQHIVNAKRLVGNENDGDVAFSTRPVFHDFALGKPNERTGTEGTSMRHERSFKHEHPVAARMRMSWIDDALWVPDQPDQHARCRVFVQFLAEERTPDFLVESFEPRNIIRIDGEKGVWNIRHEIVLLNVEVGESESYQTQRIPFSSFSRFRTFVFS